MAITNGQTGSAADFPSTSPGAVTAGTKSLTLNSSGQIDTSFLAWKGAIKSGATTYDLSTASGNQTIAHGLGVVPKMIRVKVMYSINSANSSGFSITEATYDGTTLNPMEIMMTAGTFGWTSVTGGNFRIYSPLISSAYQEGTITISSTNIVIAWTKNGSPTGTAEMIWEAIA